METTSGRRQYTCALVMIDIMVSGQLEKDKIDSSRRLTGADWRLRYGEPHIASMSFLL